MRCETREKILKMNEILAYYLVYVQELVYELSNNEFIEGDINPFGSNKTFKMVEDQTLISNKKDPDSYLYDLGNSLEKLRLEFKYKELIVLGGLATPLISQDNDYKPVKEALDWFGKRIDCKFNGGFLLKGEEVIEFIPRMFWLIRCNQAPNIMMTFENSKTIMSICDHGVLHFESYDQTELDEYIKLYESLGFIKIENCYDPVDFNSIQ